MVDGAMDALDRVAQVVLRLGDRVVVEHPGFPPLLDLLDQLGLRRRRRRRRRRRADRRRPRGRPRRRRRARRVPAAARPEPGRRRADGPAGRGARRRARRAREAIVVEDDHANDISAAPLVSLGTLAARRGPCTSAATPRATAPTCAWPRSAAPATSSPPWPTGGCSGRAGRAASCRRCWWSCCRTRRHRPSWRRRGPTYGQPAGARVATCSRRPASPSAGVDGINLWMRVADERSAAVALAARGHRRGARRAVPGASRRRPPARHRRPARRPRRPRPARSPSTSPQAGRAPADRARPTTAERRSDRSRRSHALVRRPGRGGRALRAAGLRLDVIMPADAPAGRRALAATACACGSRGGPRRRRPTPGGPGCGTGTSCPAAQGGRFIASHITIPDGGPVPDYVHHHDVRFQVIHCVRGWVRVVYEDQGEPFTMHAGDTVLQPPHIRHRVLESSAGLEVLRGHRPRRAPDVRRARPRPADAGRPTPTATSAGSASCATSSPAPRGSRGRHPDDPPWTRRPRPGSRRPTPGIGAATSGLGGARTVRATAAGAAPPGRHATTPSWSCGSSSPAPSPSPSATSRAGSTVADAVAVPAGVPFALTDATGDLSFYEVTLPA